MESKPFDPFYNVRVGGPKEKRIRRVELMGEHKPKPLYYIKVAEVVNSEGEYLSDEVLREEFEAAVGPVGDLYRPVGVDFLPKEFSFIGFFDPTIVKNVVIASKSTLIDGKPVTISEAKTWILELYPKSK
eukprot:gene9316-12552_t